MSSPDARGNPCSTRSHAALDAAESALWRLMAFYDTPLADLDTAIAADPGWALPHAMKAGFLLSLTEPGQQTAALAALDHAHTLANTATPRERAHIEAVQQVAEGRWQQACRTWDELLIDHPCDALALQWAQLWDFYRGDATGLRQRPARALPEWDEADKLYPHVLALYAFGLEENNLHHQAEEAGRRALAADARVPWAVHAVAHVMEMQGRFEEGAAWLRQTQGDWASSGLAAHLWWHKCLFRLEAMDVAGTLRLVDVHLSGDAVTMTLQRVDAASMLWRLHLLGQDVSAVAHGLLQRWTPAEGMAGANMTGAAGSAHTEAEPGHYAFNDLHLVLALLCAGEVPRAEAWLARCAARALDAEDARRSNHLMAREVGLPLMRGAIAFARGDADGAAEQIYPVRSLAQRFGGSHAQRDLIDQTLLAAAARGSRQRLGRALLNERSLAKPVTPLTRYWLEELAVSGQERA
jgi:hypothetical protein